MDATPQSRIHRDRAKRWGTSPWVAEWWANAVDYCHSSTGKRDLTTWAVQRYGAVEARKRLQACPGKPIKRTGTSSGNVKMLNSAAFDLGLSDQALILYNEFVYSRNLCQPPRTLPAVKRRRGEASWLWLARRHNSLLEGRKIPDIDWEESRRTALSQFDTVRYLAEAWRNDPTVLFETLFPRAVATIISPEVELKIEALGDEEGSILRSLHQISDAFRSKLRVLHMQHAHWSRAAALFEDIARMGLYSPSNARIKTMKSSCGGALLPVLQQSVSYCEAFHPYLDRWRDADGAAHIKMKPQYRDSSRFPRDSIDELMVKMCTDEAPIVTFFSVLSTLLEKHPDEAKKIDQFSYHVMGEFAVVQEFLSGFVDSAWGQNLRKAALEAAPRGRTRAFMGEVLFMDLAALDPTTHPNDTFGEATTLANAMRDIWLNPCFSLQPNRYINNPLFFAPGNATVSEFVNLFEGLWSETDDSLWKNAKKLDPRGQPGLVARTFGLYNPADPTRPTFSSYMIEKVRNGSLKTAAETTPAPPVEAFIPSFEVATPDDSTVSGRAFLEANQDALPRSKTKTRGTPDDANAEALQSQVAALAIDSPEQIFNIPMVLPDHFKLGRKVLKVFHRILEPPTSEDDHDQVQKKQGQVRWGDFEKAMKRVGFDVVETAGSSVRFDPPARTARPINFHRPHPDSLLTPIMLKVIGVRLRRCYGWTVDSFEQSPNTEN